MSLGAGNTGRKFDLETNLRVAEFKFIKWRGGADTIRQNQLFKDFYNLAEDDTQKMKDLYVINKSIPIRFLNGSRALKSVMSKNANLMKDFQKNHEYQFNVVKDYYLAKKEEVNIIDLADFSEIFSEQVVIPATQGKKRNMSNNAKQKPSSADEIRIYVIEKYISPARKLGNKNIKILARDIHDALGYINRYPNVCQSIDGDKFLSFAKVICNARKGPKAGSSVSWVFEIV